MRVCVAWLALLAALSGPVLAQEPPPDSVSSSLPGQTSPGAARRPVGLAARFNAANTSRDGHLTLGQAQAANWTMVARHFDEIDARHRGFVTRQDLRMFHQRMKAQHQADPAGTAAQQPPQ